MLEDDCVNHVEDNEKLVLHRAAGILRECMTSIKGMSDEYVGNDGVKIQTCREFVPDKLHDFVSWCTSAKNYEIVVSSSDKEADKKQPNLKVLSICHSIIALGRKVNTPMQLGLANQVYHESASKKLIELLSSLGHSVTYDEVRTFVTSIANDQLSKIEDVYFPHGIRPIDTNDTRTFVDAAIDNFDLNEDYLDGKRTTHAMASVMYQRCGGSEGCQNIPRTGKRSLNVAEYSEEQLNCCNKPQKRLEPATISDVSVVTKDEQNIPSFAAKIKDLLWSLSRGQNMENRSIPSWAGVQQILWDTPPLLDGRVTLRLGMHLTMAYVAAIGKLFGDGGLWGLLMATGVYAEATTRQMLQGKQYDRGVRGIRLVTEALLHLRNKSVGKWAAENGLPWLSENSEQCMQDLKYAGKSCNVELWLIFVKILRIILLQSMKQWKNLVQLAGVMASLQHSHSRIVSLKLESYYLDYLELKGMLILSSTWMQQLKSYHTSYWLAEIIIQSILQFIYLKCGN